jgi:hypothetical protein
MSYDPQLRQRIAQISARLMVQEGITDYQQAKHKAATQLGISHTRNLPKNSEIEAEILLYQRLFQANIQPYRLHHLRKVALQAMQLFTAFTPRLVGSVLQGTAHQYSDITLHLFTYSSEEVALFLLEKKIPYQLTEQRFRLPQLVSFPSFRFMAGEESIVLVVFGIDDIRWSPPSPLDGKPMRRADIQRVEQLLAEPEE